MHLVLGRFRIGLPHGKSTAVNIIAVRIAVLDEVREVEAHLSCDIVVPSCHGSPALVEVVEEEPEINGVECARVIFARDIRFEAVIVARFVVVLENSLYAALDRANRSI